jgi:hypothetical protein
LADNRQYLRIGLQGVDYLLPGNASFAIEKREHLELAGSGGIVVAWRTTSGARTPAYSVDADLNPLVRGAWQRAVFLQDAAQAVGLIADELQLLAREDVRVEPFKPLGPAPTRSGHLFGGAWVRPGHTPMLVFEPRALTEYLRRLESPA